MRSILNVLVSFLFRFLDSLLEIKYKIHLLFSKKEVDNNFIDDIYLINKNNNEIIKLENEINKNLNYLNNKLKYTDNLTTSTIKNLFKEKISKENEYLLEILFKKHGRNYLINYELNLSDDKTKIIIPKYTENELKFKNVNKISDIYFKESADELDKEELINILSEYEGPLNDFYISKDLGIPLKNIFSRKLGYFPFRKYSFILEDTFLNEYKVGENDEITTDGVLILKNTLDCSKINLNNSCEKVIINNYKNIEMDWKGFIIGIFYWIFGKQKNI